MASKWAQKLGDSTCPYMTRWVLDCRLFTLRLHCFHRSDDDRHLHDHPWWFLSILIAGTYREFTDAGVSGWRRLGSFAFRRAKHKHRVEIGPGRNCWTICITGPVRRIWGFWVDGHLMANPFYFGLFGHPPCKD